MTDRQTDTERDQEKNIDVCTIERLSTKRWKKKKNSIQPTSSASASAGKSSSHARTHFERAGKTMFLVLAINMHIECNKQKNKVPGWSGALKNGMR